jgi:hypothetical protein
MPLTTLYLLTIIFWPMSPPHTVVIVDIFDTKAACDTTKDAIKLQPYGKASCIPREITK